MDAEENILGEEITDWVAQIIEVITSASFNLLREGSLTEEEVKNYTAKNILLNIKEFAQTFPNLNF
jgi:hypothetical protein